MIAPAPQPQGLLGVLIVDDEVIWQDTLRRSISKEPDLELLGACSSASAAIGVIEQLAPDVVFLNADLLDRSGLEVFSTIESERRPAFVVVATDDRHAAKAFEVRAVAYVTNPHSRRAIRQAIGNARTHLLGWHSPFRARLQELSGERTAPVYCERFIVRVGDKLRFVRAAEVDWFEAANNYVRLHVGPRRFLLRSTLTELQDQLDVARFVRIHRSTIVNIFRISEVVRSGSGGYHLRLVDGTELSISRSYRDVVTQWKGRSGTGRSAGTPSLHS